MSLKMFWKLAFDFVDVSFDVYVDVCLMLMLRWRWCVLMLMLRRYWCWCWSWCWCWYWCWCYCCWCFIELKCCIALNASLTLNASWNWLRTLFLFNDLIFFSKWVLYFFLSSAIKLIFFFSNELLISLSIELSYSFLFSNNWVDILFLRWVDIFLKWVCKSQINSDWSTLKNKHSCSTIITASLKSFEHHQRQIDENLSITDLRHCQQTIE